uniref:Uncharacterized protein n=1 Tax=Romanomermis culicivorax TaxID=13658 RepID=A0A915JBA3_ROMCU
MEFRAVSFLPETNENFSWQTESGQSFVHVQTKILLNLINTPWQPSKQLLHNASSVYIIDYLSGPGPVKSVRPGPGKIWSPIDHWRNLKLSKIGNLDTGYLEEHSWTPNDPHCWCEAR